MKDLAPLVDDLIRLEREVAERQNEIADIKGTFIHHATLELQKLGRETKVEGRDPDDLAGQRWSWTGMDGVVRVNFPKARVISSFQLDEDNRYFRLVTDPPAKLFLPAVKRLGDPDFAKLFATYYKPCKAFREVVAKVLKPGPAAAVLAECTEPSSPRVTTEVKEVVP